MLVLSRNMQIDIILIISLVSFIWYLPISHSQNLEEKNWLDACDLQRIKEGGFKDVRARPAPSEPATPEPPTRPSRPPYKCPEAVHFRPSAPKDELLNALKQKLIIDAMERGDSVEKGDWTKDARGFMSDFYGDDDDYSDSDSDYYSSDESEK